MSRGQKVVAVMLERAPKSLAAFAELSESERTQLFYAIDDALDPPTLESKVREHYERRAPQNVSQIWTDNEINKMTNSELLRAISEALK